MYYQLNKTFLSQVKYLKHIHITILCYLYQWIASENCPKLKTFEDGRKYFWITLNKMADDLNFSRRQVQNALFRLENKDKKIKSSLQPFIYPKQVKKENRLYISLNENMIPFILEPVKNSITINYLQKKLTGNTYNIKKIPGDNKMLLDSKDINIQERKGYSFEAECLVKKLVKKNRNIFTNKLPEDYKDGKITNSYIKACKAVQDIYNGNFISSKYYPLSEKFLNNKLFDISNYKNIIKEVKGDWNKVHQLLLNAIKNYKLMFEKNRVPTKKSELTNSIQEWLYDSWNHATKEPVSYFIYSLNEPNFTDEQFSNIKADKIYDELPETVSSYGNEMIENFFTGNSHPGIIWQHIKEIYEWGNLLLDFDENARYWISKDGNIIQKFCNYLKENNLSVSSNTLDIEKAIDCNGPWCWFLSEAINNHSLNNNITNCVSEDDFYDCYNLHSKSEEIIF